MKTKMKKYQYGGVSESGYDKKAGRVGQILGGVGAAAIGTVGAIANKRRTKKLKAEEEAAKKAAEKKSKSSTSEEMKRGGTMKKMQKGGSMKKPLRKAQKGINTAGQAYMKYVPGATASDTLGKDDTRFRYPGYAEDTRKMDAKNRMLNMTYGEDVPAAAGERAIQSPKDVKAYAQSLQKEFKGMKKGGAMKTKMKTGGMVNSNAKVSAVKVAGSKGVKSGVNAKASAQKVAKGRVGGTSAAPKTATPKARYGMTTKPTMKRGGSMKKK